MSEPLTAAGLRDALLEYVFGPGDWSDTHLRRDLDDYAARAVDEALSVDEVVRMLEGIRRAIEVMGEDGECSLRTIRGVQYVTKDDAMLAVDDYLGVMRFRAAADSDITTTEVRDAIAHDWTVTTEQQERMTADLDALISRAAARAVDEALSVEKVAEWFHNSERDIDPTDRPYCPACLSDAAALVAHLRGPRP